MMMLNKKKIEIILSQLKTNPFPKPELEQYDIAGDLAAYILNKAFLEGDISGKKVLDLGCGSGRLGLGAFLLGAKKVVMVDIDSNALKVAEENSKIVQALTDKKVVGKIKFVEQDIKNFSEKADTVVQNPPFGIQKKHADRIFLRKAMECANSVYSLHRSYSKSREFIRKYVENLGGQVVGIEKLSFRMPHTFTFHKRPSIEFDVDLFSIRSKTFKSL